MTPEDKPARTAPPSSNETEKTGPKSSPTLAELDSAWNDDEDLDEDATTVAKIPQDLLALSRRGHELQKKIEEPEKHEAITAPPVQSGTEPSVIVPDDSKLPSVPVDVGSEEDDDDEVAELEEEASAEDDLSADDLDSGWEVEEERAAAADAAAGLDADARRKAAEERAAQRKEKGRAKKLAAKEKRKARAESIRAKAKQRKPKKRSTPPPPRDAAARTSGAPRKEANRESTRPSAAPKAAAQAGRFTQADLAARRDMTRMVFFVALVVFGALAIGLVRR